MGRSTCAAALAGFATGLLQVTVLRELGVSVAAGEVLLGGFLAAWLLAGAAGAAVAASRKPDAGGTLAARLAWSAAILGALGVLVARALPWMASASPGGLPREWAMAAGVTVAAGLPAAALGALFDALSRTAGAAAGVGAYVPETLGFLASGLAVPFLLERSIGTIGLAGLAVAALVLAAAPGRGGAALALFTVLAASGPPGKAAEDWLLMLQWPGALAARGSATAASTLHVVERAGGAAVYSDGVLDFPLHATAAVEAAAHLPALLHPAPRRALVIGGGLAGVCRELLEHPGLHVDLCELDPESPRRLAAIAAPGSFRELDDPRVRTIELDARAWLERADTLYDMAIVRAPAPSRAALGRYYSAEFFTRLRGRLRPGAVVAVRMPVGPGFLGQADRRLGATMALTFRRAFPGAFLVAADELTLISAPLRCGADELARRLAERHIMLDYGTVEELGQRLSKEHAREQLLWLHTGVPPATAEIGTLGLWAALPEARLEGDLDIEAYRDSLLTGLAIWAPGLAGALKRAYGPPLAASALAAFGLTLLAGAAWSRGARRRRGSAGGDGRGTAWRLSVATTGFAGMCATVLLMIAYEVRHGRLLGELALLSGVMMAGCAAGAMLASRRRLEGTPAASAVPEADLALAVTLGALGLALGLGTDASWRALPACVWSGLAIMGLLTGWQFALAARLDATSSAGAAAARCWALDLAGAAAGALTVTVLLLPGWGLAGSFLLLAACKAAAGVAGGGLERVSTRTSP